MDNPPNKIPENGYICSDKFEIDPLISAVDTSDEYIIVVVERGKACIGKKKGSFVTVVDSFDSHVMGKTRAGGQSAQRFRRYREEQKANFFQKVIRKTKDFVLNSNVKGVIVAGTNITVDEFMKMDIDHRVKQKIVGPYNVSYASKSGVQQALKKAEDDIQDKELSSQRRILDEFFNGLTSGKVVYGETEVDKAIEWNAVKSLLVSEARNNTKAYITQAEERGASVHVISGQFDRGDIFMSEFSGIGAILHYEIR